MALPLIDTHIHAPPFPAASPSNDGGVIVEPSPLKALFLRYIRARLKIAPNDLNPAATYMDRLSTEIKESKYLGSGVVFGLDGVYDSSGRLDTVNTRFMAPNGYVHALVEGRKGLAFGASINPARADAVDELLRCTELGAVLVKVLPNTQGFDPADVRFVAFYRRLAELKLPLLTHSGFEFALPALDQSLGDPGRLERALDEGVTVILAHGGTTGLFFFEKYLPVVKTLVREYENLYLDTSALTFPHRAGGLRKILRTPELAARLVFGTDFPMPSFVSPFLFDLPLKNLLEIRREGNYFDRQVRLLHALGVEFYSRVVS